MKYQIDWRPTAGVKSAQGPPHGSRVRVWVMDGLCKQRDRSDW
jgi:hypothetical protein